MRVSEFGGFVSTLQYHNVSILHIRFDFPQQYGIYSYNHEVHSGSR